jgi:serine protease Do
MQHPQLEIPSKAWRTRKARIAGAAFGAGALALLAVSALPVEPVLVPVRAQAQTVQTPFGPAPISFADIVDRVKPAVVSISISGSNPRVASKDDDRKGGRNQQQRPEDLFPGLPDEFYEYFKNLPRGMPNMPRQRPTQSQGSGFVISEDGYVVTNNHVIDNAAKITVSFDEHNKYEARLIGTDSRSDVAVLKINADRKFPFVKFSDKPTRVGDWVIAVGNPFGLGGTVTAGIVSALARGNIGDGPYDYMQIDAAVNRGNSGGPTFNLDGEVVGVNTAIFSPSGGNVGIAFAIPAATATKVVAQLRKSGTVTRGWLGVQIQNIDEDTAASLGLAAAKGALVKEVVPNGPGAAAGLKSQDAVLAVNNVAINDSRELAQKIGDYAPNTTVDVKVWRGNKEEIVKVKLGTFPTSREEIAKLEEGQSSTAPTSFSSLGLAFESVRGAKTSRDGVQISEVEPNSDAAEKGLSAGDVVTQVNQQPVSSPEDVEAAVKRARDMGRPSVLLSVRSQNQQRLVAVQIKKG